MGWLQLRGRLAGQYKYRTIGCRYVQMKSVTVPVVYNEESASLGRFPSVVFLSQLRIYDTV